VGAIVSSTDAATVFSVLRSQGISLKGENPATPGAGFGNERSHGRLSDDGDHPSRQSPLLLVSLFFKQMLIGGAIGWVLGRGAVPAINRLNLDAEGFYSALTVTIVLFAYGITTALGGVASRLSIWQVL